MARGIFVYRACAGSLLLSLPLSTHIKRNAHPRRSSQSVSRTPRPAGCSASASGSSRTSGSSPTSACTGWPSSSCSSRWSGQPPRKPLHLCRREGGGEQQIRQFWDKKGHVLELRSATPCSRRALGARMVTPMVFSPLSVPPVCLGSRSSACSAGAATWPWAAWPRRGHAGAIGLLSAISGGRCHPPYKTR